MSTHLSLADVEDVAAAPVAHAGAYAPHRVAAGPDQRANHQQRGQELEELVDEVHVGVPVANNSLTFSLVQRLASSSLVIYQHHEQADVRQW